MAGTLVQSKIGEAAASGTTVATGSFGSNVTSGNTLVIVTNSDTADTVTVTKNSGTATIGSVTEQTSISEAGTLEELTLLFVSVTGTGSLDLLVTFGSSQANKQILAQEWSGLGTMLGAQAQTDTGNNPTTTCTVNATSQPATAIAFCIDVQGGTPTVGTGYTDGGTFGSSVHFIRAQYKAISATGNVNSDFGNAGFDRNNSVLVIFADATTQPTITSQPTPQMCGEHRTATFSVSATASAGSLTYQWKDNRTGSFANVIDGAGGTSASYTTAFMEVSQTGRLYQCVVTDSNGSTTTSSVSVTVVPFLKLPVRRERAAAGMSFLLDAKEWWG